jgi:hypothetical protein
VTPKVACAPDGTPVAVSFALPEKPLAGVSAMVDVAGMPFEVTEEGLAPSEKVPEGGGGGGLFVAVEPSAFTAKLSITACVV